MCWTPLHEQVSLQLSECKGGTDPFTAGLRPHVAFALQQLQRGHGYVVARHRLRCRVVPHPGSPSLSLVQAASDPVPVLHDVVIHRVPHPSTAYVRLLVEKVHVTTVIGDGLVVCTPSGSAGFARTMGATAMDVSLRCLQVCPINPNSLAFRPIVLPADAGVELQVRVALLLVACS